ncbi:MAG: energy transducer TonB, partial [Cardiobacterium sp.]
ARMLVQHKRAARFDRMIRERPPITPPPRPVNIVPPATNHYGQISNANAANNGRANGGTRDGAQSGAKITEKNHNAGLQGRIASTVQKRKGRIRERGTAVVAFDIQASGQFTNIRIEQSSGVQRIDDLILESVRSVGSYAPPPEGRTVPKRIPLQVR